MIQRPTCLLYSHDPELTQRVQGLLTTMAKVRQAEEMKALEHLLRGHHPSPLLLDVRDERIFEMIQFIQEKYPHTVLIVIGALGSDPMLEVERMDIYAMLDLNFDRHQIQMVMAQAFHHVELLSENVQLKLQLDKSMQYAERPSMPSAERASTSTPLALRHFTRASRHFEDVDALLNSIVEAVTQTTNVTRVGIFSRARDSETFRLRAGINCLQDSYSLEYFDDDHLVSWLEIHAHMICHANLDHMSNPADRLMLQQTLNSYGAEVIIPLNARGRIIGWLYLGHRITGIPFSIQDLEEFMTLADHITHTIENALLYEEVAVQKTLAETLLQSMPIGIVAVDSEAKVRWFNSVAEEHIEVSFEEAINKPSEALGSQLSSLLREAISGQETAEPMAWKDVKTAKQFEVQTRRLMNQDVCLGAVALIENKTDSHRLEAKRAQLERTSFWTELAAAMSHEIRNPLTPIKTYAQMLVKEYDDPEFRNDFSQKVDYEISRLDQIIDQINDFAHPPSLQIKNVDLIDLATKAKESAKAELGKANFNPTIQNGEAQLRRIEGDERALTETFQHLFINAYEAYELYAPTDATNTDEKTEPPATPQRRHLKFELSPATLKGRETPAVRITISDGAGGLHETIIKKEFSPFSTTKARGMGLGLPIAQRTAIDHNGTIEVVSNGRGTTVWMILPLNQDLFGDEDV